jgi:molecular chaperone Hsp33
MLCELRTLLFTTQAARAQLVHLQASWQRIIQGHHYPPAIERMLGELVAASALLSASLKFNGSLVLQVKGDGPVSIVVAECSSELGLRATVMFDKDACIADEAGFQELVNAGGKGRFVLILDPKDRLPGQHPYQGIISLQGDSIAQTIENYMMQSEQLQTRLWLQARGNSVAGVLLQQMPETGGMLDVQITQSEAQPDIKGIDPQTNWDRLIMLCNTLKPGEMLDTDPGTMVKRLFWQEPHDTLNIRNPIFRCTCSRDKVSRMLKSLGETEIREALEEQTHLTIHCDYCNTAYEFDAVDCMALFTDSVIDANVKPGQSGLH